MPFFFRESFSPAHVSVYVHADDQYYDLLTVYRRPIQPLSVGMRVTIRLFPLLGFDAMIGNIHGFDAGYVLFRLRHHVIARTDRYLEVPIDWVQFGPLDRLRYRRQIRNQRPHMFISRQSQSEPNLSVTQY
jgi:hypothetical protein